MEEEAWAIPQTPWHDFMLVLGIWLCNFLGIFSTSVPSTGLGPGIFLPVFNLPPLSNLELSQKWLKCNLQSDLCPLNGLPDGLLLTSNGRNHLCHWCASPPRHSCIWGAELFWNPPPSTRFDRSPIQLRLLEEGTSKMDRPGPLRRPQMINQIREWAGLFCTS